MLLRLYWIIENIATILALIILISAVCFIEKRHGKTKICACIFAVTRSIDGIVAEVTPVGIDAEMCQIIVEKLSSAEVCCVYKFDGLQRLAV